MPVIYEANCVVCGEKLTINFEKMDRAGDIFITIEPCENCLSDSFDKGYDTANKE